MVDSHVVSNPICSGGKLSKSDGNELLDPTIFHSIIGSLQYLTITQPNFTFAVGKVAQFQSHPMETHLKAGKRFLRYIKGTSSFGLWYLSSNDWLTRLFMDVDTTFTLNNINAFSDADWANNPDDQGPITSACLFVGQNLICWCSKKEISMCQSSTEAEYHALANATTQAKWLCQIFHDLGIRITKEPMIYCDNQSSIFLASNPTTKSHTQNVDTDFHFICELLDKGAIEISYIPINFQIADIFTKGLSIDQFSILKAKLKLHLSSSI